jgi:thiamine biosynthesis lipoprotein
VQDINKSRLVVILLIFLIVMLGGFCQCQGSPQKFEEMRPLMDTYVTIIVYADKEVGEEAISAAFARMEEIEKIASIYDSQSEAFRLNQDGYLEAPSDELLELINMSLDYSELTDGSFDITVQPLLDLWEYKPDAEKQLWELSESERNEKINEALTLVGFDKIVVEENEIYFEKEGMGITLGGIAKGYAVDEALSTLEAMGVNYALVDAGGDIGTLGYKPGGELWEIALVNPEDTSQCLATFEVQDKAVATSGNYERYFNPEKTAHHIVNPKTGYSALGCISVTIIANVECFIVDADGIIYHSSGLSEYLSGG